MTVKFFIPRHDGTEKGFDHTFERIAAVEIANRFHKTYGDSDSDYYLIFNVDTPPADMVVLTNWGAGVVDFKHIGGVVRGTVDSGWTFNMGGKFKKLEVSRRFKNPFDQVRTYRFELYKAMMEFANIPADEGLPAWMGERSQFHLQAAVCFTDHCTIELELDPDRTRPWFEAILQKDLPRWAYSLTFTARGKREPLTPDQMTTLAETLLDVGEWGEVHDLIEGGDIFGYLRLKDSRGTAVNHPLSGAIVALGREADNDILLGAVGVSRHHARFLWKDDGVFIEDLGSTNGTWLNGERIPPNAPQPIYHGDKLVFGPCEHNKPKPNAQSGEFTTTISTSPETQIFPRI